ncbi:MAG: FAD-binding oxidoreductase [Chloroflexi bacterium]|nr:FAD-binding oxidoreductase [Chloroflexota bacterium]
MLLESTPLSGAAIRDLEAHLLGELIHPAHYDYAAARQVWNRAIDWHPALIVRAADAADVIRTIAFAREQDLPLAVRSGGHSMAGHGTVDGGVVLDLGRLQGLSIDPERRVAWAQPGLTWGQYAERANAYGLATSAGDTASVGLGGLTLGGGIGWMVRSHGLTIDNLLSVELVTADGRLLRASAEEHPDLFWGLRGGGGNFGVATAFQFRLRPAGLILGGALVYPATRAVLRGWADYAVQAPDELTTIVFIMPAPPAPFIPPDQVGKLVALIGLCYVGDLETGQRIVEPLRRLGSPMVADLSGPMPYPAMFALTEEASRPEQSAVRSGYLHALAGDSLDAIVEHAARMPTPGGLVQLRALGGAMARVPADATAFAHRDKRFMATVMGSTHDPAAVDRQRAWAEGLWGVLRPSTEGVYMNFLEDEGPSRVREAYAPATFARLVAIKRQYDPTNLFRLNQNISPTDCRSGEVS